MKVKKVMLIVISLALAAHMTACDSGNKKLSSADSEGSASISSETSSVISEIPKEQSRPQKPTKETSSAAKENTLPSKAADAQEKTTPLPKETPVPQENTDLPKVSQAPMELPPTQSGSSGYTRGGEGDYYVVRDDSTGEAYKPLSYYTNGYGITLDTDEYALRSSQTGRTHELPDYGAYIGDASWTATINGIRMMSENGKLLLCEADVFAAMGI